MGNTGVGGRQRARERLGGSGMEAGRETEPATQVREREGQRHMLELVALVAGSQCVGVDVDSGHAGTGAAPDRKSVV